MEYEDAMRLFQRQAAKIRFTIQKLRYAGHVASSGMNYLSGGDLLIHGGGRLELEARNVFEKRFDIEIKGGDLKIGGGNYFNKNVKIVCFDQIVIGSNCLFADSVHIYDHDHDHSDNTEHIGVQGYITQPVAIGNNVWVGAKATILKGVTIGDGAIIAAGAVVTKNIPPMTIAGGVPARVLKERVSWQSE